MGRIEVTTPVAAPAGADGEAARRRAAAAVRAARDALALRLAAVVAHWEKYADRHRADPQGFAAEEKGAFVDYLATYLESGDATFRQLMIGERIKQFFRPDLDADALRLLIAEVLLADRAAILETLPTELDEAARGAVSMALDEVDAVLLAEAQTTLRVLFIGDCLYLDVIGFLAPACLEQGIAITPWFIASKDPADQRAALAKLADQPFDAIFFSPLTYEFSPAWARLLGSRGALAGTRTVAARAEEAVAPAVATLDLLAQLFECPIHVHNAAAVQRHEGRAKERLRHLLTARTRRVATAAATEAIERAIDAANARSIRHVFLFDERPIVARMGGWEAGRLFYRASIQHPAVFGREVAADYARILFVHARLMKRKLVVCDLDNTLWEGVIGEGNGVTHHADRQRTLRRLKAKGVVLAINSKNDRQKVVWGEGSVLGHDDFVSTQINWDPKVVNMRRIADHLNLKPKDFVFVDDRADERALVSDAFPGLLALDALDPRSWDAIADWAEWLPEVDADRTLFYRQRDQRREFLDTEIADGEAERAAAFSQLGLAVSIREAEEGDLGRVAELINRTNQFNTAASRVTRAEIAALHGNPQARVLVASAADRFGTMGIVSVLVAVEQGEAVEIAHFVLSCRVFGYGIERALLSAVRGLSPKPVTGMLVETPFNQPCRAVYPDNGFVAEGNRWTLAAGADPQPAPEWLAVENTTQPL